jgi:hypothetical protein
VKGFYKSGGSTDWWNGLDINDKVKFKKSFEVYRNTKEGSKFPSMYDLRHIRISQLSEKHITRIWAFK